MINTEITTTKGMEQAKNRMAMEKKKANEERRKFENHHNYMMGGAVHKYFKECFSFGESEINEILEVAFKTTEVQKTISAIKRSAGVQIESSPVESEVSLMSQNVPKVSNVFSPNLWGRTDTPPFGCYVRSPRGPADGIAHKRRGQKGKILFPFVAKNVPTSLCNLRKGYPQKMWLS